MAELKYEGGHISADQAWKLDEPWRVKATGGHVVWLQLAGIRHDGSTNNFASKHLLAPSKKANRTSEQKQERRLMHRADKGGVQAFNPYQGGKAPNAGMSRSTKYGGIAPTANTVIDLGVLDLNSVLTQMAVALVGVQGWQTLTERHDVVFRFSKPCVKTVTYTVPAAGGVATFTHSVPVSGMQVHAYRVGNYSFEVFHCHGAV